MTNPTDSIHALTILPIAGAWLCLIFAAPAHADHTELTVILPAEGVTGGIRTQHVADFDSYASCVSAAQVSIWSAMALSAEREALMLGTIKRRPAMLALLAYSSQLQHTRSRQSM